MGSNLLSFSLFVVLQDYEYASYNPVAYDLANHFCEMVANYHSDTPHILDYSKYPGEFSQCFVSSFCFVDFNFAFIQASLWWEI